MIDTSVKPEDHAGIQRLVNSQLILSFTLCDLKDQFKQSCVERGEIVEKILALVFDMFQSYEYSFDRIIDIEVKRFKQELVEANAFKDLEMEKKNNEMNKVMEEMKKVQTEMLDKENKIMALEAQRKALVSQNIVMSNLIDNVIFNYKGQLDKILKQKEQRILVRDFIFQLTELRKFSGNDKQEIIEISETDQELLKESLKRKFNKEI